MDANRRGWWVRRLDALTGELNPLLALLAILLALVDFSLLAARQLPPPTAAVARHEAARSSAPTGPHHIETTVPAGRLSGLGG